MINNQSQLHDPMTQMMRRGTPAQPEVEPVLLLTACGTDLVVRPFDEGPSVIAPNYFDCDPAPDATLAKLHHVQAASSAMPGRPYIVSLGKSGADVMVGGAGRDFMLGKGGRDVIIGRAGDDVLQGGDDGDYLDGGDGNDHLIGEHGDDFLDGGNGGDAMFGGPGRDRLDGGDGNDKLHGGAGNDILEGGDGNDVLDGGAGHDKLCGGAGNDIYRFGRGSGHDVIHDLSPYGISDDEPFDGDWVALGPGIDQDHVWFQRQNDDLKLTLITTGDTLTMRSWYQEQHSGVGLFVLDGPKSLLASQVDTLVDAMAGFAVPAVGTTSLPVEQYGGMSSVIASVWK